MSNKSSINPTLENIKTLSIIKKAMLHFANSTDNDEELRLTNELEHYKELAEALNIATKILK